MKITSKLWIGLLILAVVSPAGLVLPEHFKAGAAWGEWGIEEIKELAGYIPEGLARLASLWSAPIPDYAFKGWEEKGLPALSFAYIISALAGIALTAGAVFLLGLFLHKKDQ